MHSQTPSDLPAVRTPRRRAGVFLLLAVVAAFGVGACSAGASALPSVTVPTLDANATPVAACVDAATKAVIDQLTAPDADVPALLADNTDLLIAGLNTLQPADAATTTWRDELVGALQSGDLVTAAEKVDELASGGVTLAAC